MSKLDHILAFAEEIESRSIRLADAASTSIDLINHISYINPQLIHHDHDIDEIRHLMDFNQSCLIQLNALSDRSFFLESNLPINDHITNFTSFENLNHEYCHLLLKLELNNNQIDVDGHAMVEDVGRNLRELNIDDSYAEEDDVEEEEAEDGGDGYNNNELQSTSSLLEPPDLKKMISISNLQLKPMRCASSSSTTATPLQPRSIQKKKSRYRLSSIYNINPVALDEESVAFHSNTTSSVSSSSPPSEDSDKMMKNSLSQSFDTIESHFSNHSPLEKENDHYGVTTKAVHHDETVIIRQPSPSPSPSSSTLHKHTRSNSLPTSSSTKSIDQTDLFKELDCHDDYLRFNRLKHFISISNLPKRSKIATSATTTAEEDAELDDSLFYQDLENSLTPEQCLDNCDVCSVISDISYYSPEKQQAGHEEPNGGGINFDFDTYHSFLRKSKLNLNEAYHNAFPHLYRQHQEHNQQDVKDASELHQQPHTQEESHTSHHFKNPINAIGSTRPHTVSPTLDTTFQQQEPHPVSTTSGSLHRLSSRKLLTQVISQSAATVHNQNEFATPSTLPLKSTSLLASSPPLPIKCNNASSPRVGPIVSKSAPSIATSTSSLGSPSSSPSSSSSPSFTHNLINFMSIAKPQRRKQQQQQQQQQQQHHHFSRHYSLHEANPFAPVVVTKPPTPEKIRQLKKQKRLKRHVPILVPNEAQLKRIPRRQLGTQEVKCSFNGSGLSRSFQNEDASFARLTILRNQKYINHDEGMRATSSMFNNPIIRGCNEDAIREALSASLLD